MSEDSTENPNPKTKINKDKIEGRHSSFHSFFIVLPMRQ